MIHSFNEKSKGIKVHERKIWISFKLTTKYISITVIMSYYGHVYNWPSLAYWQYSWLLVSYLQLPKSIRVFVLFISALAQIPTWTRKIHQTSQVSTEDCSFILEMKLFLHQDQYVMSAKSGTSMRIQKCNVRWISFYHPTLFLLHHFLTTEFVCFCYFLKPKSCRNFSHYCCWGFWACFGSWNLSAIKYTFITQTVVYLYWTLGHLLVCVPFTAWFILLTNGQT